MRCRNRGRLRAGIPSIELGRKSISRDPNSFLLGDQNYSRVRGKGVAWGGPHLGNTQPSLADREISSKRGRDLELFAHLMNYF